MAEDTFTPTPPAIPEELKQEIITFFSKAKARGDKLRWNIRVPGEWQPNPLMSDEGNETDRKLYEERMEGVKVEAYLTNERTGDEHDITVDDTYLSPTLTMYDDGRSPKLNLFILRQRFKDANVPEGHYPWFHGRINESYTFDCADYAWLADIEPLPPVNE